MKNIKLNKDISIDLPKLIQSRAVILANSGGGKSWAIRRIAEQANEQIQTIIIDPEGEFSSLREKYDFILAGKDADVPVEVRSASLLATKLLELGKSAIIDLYELSKQDRQRFVKVFFNTMVDAPKELYHPVLLILDEAHDYAPEGKPSEATQAVEDMASKGRKRGYCLIPASQRISKLSKNVSAECNNKLIGRASQDIDMKRAGDELGFNKEKTVELRQLQPGEFFAFGTAISDEVIKVRIGEVKTSHAKVGYQGVKKVPPASDVIRKVLGALKDLPQEAEKEATTVAELKKENKHLKQMNTNLLKHHFQKDLTQEEIDKIVTPYLSAQARKFDTERKIRIKEYQSLMDLLSRMRGMIPETFPAIEVPEGSVFIPDRELPRRPEFAPRKIEISGEPMKVDIESIKIQDGEKSFGKCPRAIYSYLVMNQGRAMTKTQIAVATGYSQNSGGFNNSISELSSAGLVSRGNALISLNGAVRDDLLVDVDISLEKWLPKLGACPRKVWELMLNHHEEETWTKEQIANETGYSVTSGGFNNSLSEMSSLGLIERLPGAQIRINPEILEL